MKKTTKLCAILLTLAMLMSSLALLAIPTAASETSTIFTRIDMSTETMTAATDGKDRWENGEDNGAMTLAQVCPTGGAVAGNAVTMSNVKLDADKDYTVEVKARFIEGYASPNANPTAGESRGFGLIVGSANQDPWGSDGRHYTGMFDRGTPTRDFRVFTKYYTLESDQDTLCNTEVPVESFQSTDWHTIRFTIDYEAAGTTMAVYFDGVKVGETLLDGKKTDGTALEKEIWEGGYIGLVAYKASTKVEFKDLCYTEGVTTAIATFGSSVPADVFTRIDMSTETMTTATDGKDRWENGEDNGAMTLAQVCPTGGAVAGNAVTMSNVKLDADKDYTVEVKARFIEGYASPNANPTAGESRGFGLIVGSANQDPWGSDGRHYTGMFDRGTPTRDFRVFTKYYTLESDQDTLCNTEVPVESFQSTDWHAIRFTIDYETAGTTMAVYFDGVKVGETLLDGKKTDGTALEKEIWEGGYIGLVAYKASTKVEFKDLCYKEGVTTEPAVFDSAAGAKKEVTIHYVYEDGAKAADSVIQERDAGSYYSITSPTIEGFIADQEKVSGTVGSDNVVVTVTYYTSYTVTIRYVDEKGNKMNEDVIITNLKNGDTYSVETMRVTGHDADKEIVAGTVANENVEVVVTYIARENALTVKYVYKDGTKAHDDIVVEVAYGANGEVASPEIAGFTPDQSSVKISNMKKDTTVTVTYTANAASDEETTTGAGDDNDEKQSGCGSSMGLLLIPALLAGAVLTVCKKKK